MTIPLLILLGALALFGCGRGDSAIATPCDPLESETEALELGTIVAVGRAMDGKLYAVDRAEGSDQLRVLESEGDFLFLRTFAGGGTSNSGDVERHLLTVESEAMGYSLIVEIEAGEVRMARTTRDEPRMLRVADVEPPDEVLEIVDPGVLDQLTPRALPTEVVIEYFARTPQGELLLVIHPDDDQAVYEDFRLFFGDESELIERELREVTRARDGGSTHLIFDLDGELADAFFPVLLGSDEPPQATLEIGGDAMDLERLPDEAAAGLADATFSCL